MKNLFLFLLLLIGGTQLQAQDVYFVSNAPRNVVQGTQFQLQYILSSASEGKDLEVSEDIKGFTVLYGPTESTLHSTTIINGKRSSESSTTYTYLLQADEEGTYTLPAAKIKVNNRNYVSSKSTIKVLPPDKGAANKQDGGQPDATSTSSKGGVVDDKDAFIRAIFSKTKVSEQEAIVATFRLYTVLNFVHTEKIEFPEFDGFMTEDIDLSPNRQIEMEHYKGRNYFAIDVKKTLLFPQRSGKITIPSGLMDMVFEVHSGKVINHPVFGPQEIMTEARKLMKTSPVTLNVETLPTKPLGFSGGVGTFDITANISDTKVKANEAITLTLKISGTGNMKLIKTPELELDKNIEAYDPKVDNNFSITANGLTGTKTIEYLLIPRHEGKYTIPAIEFSYYDPKLKTYKTTTTSGYELDVAIDTNAKNNTATSYNNQREVTVEQDIRYLKLGDYHFFNSKDFAISKTTYPLWYIIPFLLFVIIVIVYRKQIQANADIAGMKNKKANKVATRRLRLAKKYLATHNKDGFYEEVLRAVWGYLSDKLTISVSDLSRENVEIELLKYGAHGELVREYIEILDTCEFARYAPAESDKAMDKLYADTVDAIGKMENTVKVK